MGMAHRGRLNVLANIFNKTYKEINNPTIVSKTSLTPILVNDLLNRSFINSLICFLGKKSTSPFSKIQSMIALLMLFMAKKKMVICDI